ncbi:MAG: DUF58 domain-containing protein [Rhodospirillales bacterium]|nr:DUF58 domain-containing protein [Rhodospirillales bacterium]
MRAEPNRGRARPERAAQAATLVRAETLAAILPPLLVAAERVAATVSQGVHGRRQVGQGETFWQFRRYEPGDPTQAIDWRQSAKSQRIFIRQTEWEAAQSVWLWRDGSASMDWRSRDGFERKRDRAELLLLALAALLARGGEHLALLGAGGAPGSGRAVLRRLYAGLAEKPHDRSRADAGASAPPVKAVPRFARVVLFADFLLPLDEIAAVVGAYARRGVRGHLLQILDPAEETLPFSGRIRFEGCENEGEALFGRAESVREAYRAAIAGHRRGLAALAADYGWTFAVHHTDQPPEPALLGLFTAMSATPRALQP